MGMIKKAFDRAVDRHAANASRDPEVGALVRSGLSYEDALDQADDNQTRRGVADARRAKGRR